MVTIHELLSLVRKLSNRVTSLIKRGTVIKLTDPSDSGQFQVYQVSFMGSISNCEAVWPYGLAGILPKDSTMTMLNVMGNEANKAGIASFPQERFKDLEVVKDDFDIAIGNFKSLSRAAYLSNGDIVTIATKDYNLTVNQDLTVQIDGSATVNANANIAVTAATITANATTSMAATAPIITANATDSITVTTPTLTLEGDLQVNGDITSTGTVTAPIVNALTSLIAAGKQHEPHTHSGVVIGTDNSGPNN